MAFNRDKYKKFFEDRYGAGSYDAGLSNARSIGATQGEAEVAKLEYERQVKLAKEAAKEAEKAARNKTYNDALSSWNGKGEGLVSAGLVKRDGTPLTFENAKKEGAYRTAEEIKNDPYLQEQIKGNGYSVSEFIDAMYDALSDGQFRSEREFKEYTKQLTKETNKKPTTQELVEQYSKKENKTTTASKKKDDDGPSLWKDITTPLKQFGKGVKNIFDGDKDTTFTGAFEELVQKGLETERSPITKELNRGLARMANTTTLGTLEQAYKKTNDGEQAAQFKSDDRGTAGKIADFGYDALGYLVPGSGAYKAVRGLGMGLKPGSKGFTKLRQLAQEGALTGGALSAGEVYVREGLNAGDTDYKDNLAHIGLGVGFGAVADPAIYGLGKGISKAAENVLAPYAKGEVPTYSGNVSQEVVDSLQPSVIPKNNTQSNAFYEQLTQPAVPKGQMLPQDQVAYQNQLKQSQKQAEANAFNQEFNEAVEQQFQYLKNSMGKGTQPGGLVRDQEGFVTGAYGRVSNNPKWYQDFYAQNGRKPTNAELKELAEIHVREGFEDEVGSLPPWQPKAVQEIDDQINDLQEIVDMDWKQEPAIRPIIEALEQDKAEILQAYENAMIAPPKPSNEPSLDRLKGLNNEPNNNSPFLMRLGDVNKGKNGEPSINQQIDPIQPSPQNKKVPPPKPLNREQELGLQEIKRIDKEIQKLKQQINSNPKQKKKLKPKIEQLEKDKNNLLLKLNLQYFGDEALPHINNPKEIVKRQIDTDGKRPKSKWSFDKEYTKWVDDLYPLAKATKELGGKDLPFDENPYMQARLSRGVSGKAETYLRGGIYNEQGEKIGKSLEEIIKPIEKKLDDFLAYSASKRALDYDEKGLTAGIKPKDVEGITDPQLAKSTIRQIDGESPEIKAAHKELVAYNNRLMDELVDAGVLSKETVESLRKDNPNYIPMFRVQEPKTRGFEPLSNPKKTYANLGEPFKTRTGSEKPIINPIESIVKNTYLTLNMAERNKAGRLLLDLTEQSDNNPWTRIKGTEKGLSVDDVGKSLDEANAQLNDGNSDAVDNLFKGEGNKVYVYRDGQRVELELQEDLYRAMLSLDAQKQNFFIKLLAAPTRALRTGAVLSPDFGPVNIFRDQLSALINSKYGFIPFVDMARGLKSVLKKDDAYQTWKNSGGANSVLSTLDREYLQQDLRKMIKQSLWSNTKDRLKHPLRTVLEPLRKMSEITEEATRMGEFKKGLKKGATPKEAAFASRDLIDFNRAGTLGRPYNQIAAFFNAAVQSTDKLVRTFKEKPLQSSVKATMGITLPTIVAYYYNKDKEWYKELPQRDKDLFWHFEIDDQVYKLPKPFEAGIIFGTSFERMLDFMETNDPEAFEGFGKTVKDAFTPTWIATAAAPWIEVYANKSMYFDSPIVPRREQDLLPEDQYGPYQSELAKGFGKLLNKSPRKAEHVFKGYTGGLGKYFLMGTDAAAKVAGSDKPELPDRGMADWPILNRFVVKNLEGNNQSVDDFYKRMEKLRQENLSAKKHNPDHENTDVYKVFNQIGGDISELQALKRAIIDNPDMTGKQKAEEIKKIDTAITQLAKSGLQIPE